MIKTLRSSSPLHILLQYVKIISQELEKAPETLVQVANLINHDVRMQVTRIEGTLPSLSVRP
jgi:preprotein translocase subunit SecB